MKVKTISKAGPNAGARCGENVREERRGVCDVRLVSCIAINEPFANFRRFEIYLDQFNNNLYLTFSHFITKGLYRYTLLLNIVYQKAELNLVFVQNILHHASAVAVAIGVPRLLRIHWRGFVFHAGDEAVKSATNFEVRQGRLRSESAGSAG